VDIHVSAVGGFIKGTVLRDFLKVFSFFEKDNQDFYNRRL
jgi:hypothetical protein